MLFYATQELTRINNVVEPQSVRCQSGNSEILHNRTISNHGRDSSHGPLRQSKSNTCSTQLYITHSILSAYFIKRINSSPSNSAICLNSFCQKGNVRLMDSPENRDRGLGERMRTGQSRGPAAQANLICAKDLDLSVSCLA